MKDLEKQLEAKDVEAKDKITRREFLRGLLMASAASVLAACGPSGSESQSFEHWRTATPGRVLASPRAPAGQVALGEATETPTSTPQPGGLPLESFLALSAILTGVENLDPVVGRVYLENLQASEEFDVTLTALYEQAGFQDADGPTSIDALQQAGIFETEATSKLADTIIEYWYGGVYTTPEGEQKVATFVDALGWKTLHFTKPNSICAEPGFWERRPEVWVPRD